MLSGGQGLDRKTKHLWLLLLIGHIRLNVFILFTLNAFLQKKFYNTNSIIFEYNNNAWQCELAWTDYNMVWITKKFHFLSQERCSTLSPSPLCLSFEYHIVIEFNINRPGSSSLGAYSLNAMTQCRQLPRKLSWPKGAQENIHTCPWACTLAQTHTPLVEAHDTFMSQVLE